MAVVTTVCFVAFVLVVLVSDSVHQRLPNVLTLSGLVLALTLRALSGGASLASGLEAGLIGLLIGVPLFAVGAIGGGDAKLLAALGAFAGLGQLGPALLGSGVLGGVLTVVVVLHRRMLGQVLLSTGELALYVASMGRRGARPSLATPGSVRVPYGVAIALGFLLAWFLPPGR